MTVGVVLINPKYAHNVGHCVRAASCLGADFVWYTGDRIRFSGKNGLRIPREERMREYADVDFQHVGPKFFADPTVLKMTPVAVEFDQRMETLPQFEHPENPLYVFGPEDGGLGKVIMMHCHRFVTIPTKHCVNLAAAVYITLYDRSLG